MSNQLNRILLVSSARSPQNVAINEEFAQQLQTHFDNACTIQVVHFDDIAFRFADGATHAFLLDDTRSPVTDFDLVYIKSYNGRRGNDFVEQANALAVCLQELKVPFIGHEVVQAVSLTKLSQYARLAAARFSIPKTVFMAPARLKSRYDLIVQELGSPFILKDIGGFGGENNFLVKDQAHFAEITEEHVETPLIAQQFIANDGDLRVVTMGEKPRMIISRRRLDDSTHLNNTSQGAAAQLLPLETLNETVMDMAIRAASLFQREIAGVDIMFESETEKPYILEVNAGPQLGSGAFTDEKIVALGTYLKELLPKQA